MNNPTKLWLLCLCVASLIACQVSAQSPSSTILDIKNLRKIDKVMKGGHVFEHAALVGWKN